MMMRFCKRWTSSLAVLSVGLVVASGKPSAELIEADNVESPFDYAELRKGRAIRAEREKRVLELRARARNRLFMLKQRALRKEIGEKQFNLEVHKLKQQVNTEAQQLIFGVAADEANARDDYLKKFGCVKWTDEVMQRVASFSPLIEIGAGYGRWKKCLEEDYGANVLAFDDFSELHFGSEIERKNSGVFQGNEAMIPRHKDRTLLLVCPPPSDMAMRCLNQYKGKYFIFVGEGREGAHANGEFFNQLEKNWKVLERLDLENFSECYEKCFILERKSRSIFPFW